MRLGTGGLVVPIFMMLAFDLTAKASWLLQFPDLSGIVYGLENVVQKMNIRLLSSSEW